MRDPLWILLDSNDIVLEVTDPSATAPSENHRQLPWFYAKYNLVRNGWKYVFNSDVFNYIPNTEQQFDDLKTFLNFLVDERTQCESSHAGSQEAYDNIQQKSLDMKNNIDQYVFGSDQNSANLLYYFQENIHNLNVLVN